MSRTLVWWFGIAGCCATTWWGLMVAPLPRPDGFLSIAWVFGLLVLPYVAAWIILATPSLAAGVGSAMWMAGVLAGVSLAFFVVAFVVGVTVIFGVLIPFAVPVAAAVFGDVFAREHERIRPGGDPDAWRRIHRRGFLVAGWGVPVIWAVSAGLLIATAPHPAQSPTDWDRFSSLGPAWGVVALSLAGAVPGLGWHAAACLRQLHKEQRTSPSGWRALLVVLGPYVLVAGATARQEDLSTALAWPVLLVEKNLTRAAPGERAVTRE